MKKKLVLLLLSLSVVALVLAGCGGGDNGGESEEATADGPIVVGCSYVAGNTNPVDSAWDLTSHGISEGIYMQDAKGNLVSRFVQKLERKDDLTWTATLTGKVKFSDGSDCDAKALADCMNYLQKNNEMANGTAGVVKFTAEKDGTLTIKTEKPTPVMESLLAEWCNVVFKQDGDDFLYTGPYMVKKLDSEVSLELEPNPYYDDRAEQRSDVTLKVFSDTAAMEQAFEAGEVDLMFGLTPESAETLKGKGFTVKDYDAGYQYFGFTNLKDGPMKDADVRKAIDLLLDREEMVKALQGGRVANGIFAQYYSFAGDVKVETKAEEAAKLLEKAGYKKNDEGYYEKDGKKLTLHMVTYSARADLPILMQLAASQLTTAGIDSKTDVVDDINANLEGGDYDLVFYAQHTAPSGEPSAFLNMALAKDGSRNYAGYSSDKVNKLLDEMGKTQPGKDRDKQSRDIQAIVAEDLPMIYLVDPQWHVALSERVKAYEPYCGDYYCVNAELGL
ncbi:ABC transporter substrate-binding protein [Eubacterium sp. AB3007]|uniref:ABC transporter substrate-binding protein n=1 Tax=Eubacterium sp. AB3007 TaxID=1392487 RepID=UPI000488DE7F|nr:ABC transporter substrate-binding protein [Eubacterium sp. AB3007]